MKGPIQTFNVEPSRYLLWGVAVIHAVACVAVLLADLDWWLRIPVMIAVIVSLVVTVRWPRRILLRCQPDGALAIKEADGWTPRTARHSRAGGNPVHFSWASAYAEATKRGAFEVPDWQAVELLPDTVVLAWLVVLRYRDPGQRWAKAIVILPDSLEPEAFRRLRVWLKWRARLPGRQDEGPEGGYKTNQVTGKV